MKEALFYSKADNLDVKCHLCPHQCLIKQGHKGLCGVRENREGILYTLNYGKLSAIHIDPIEKKPLHHFMSGTNTLSVGSYGCNLNCQYCQNYSISKKCPYTLYKSPEEVVTMAIDNHLPSISFTYNEPTIFYEAVLDTAKLAKKAGLKTIMVTNGFITNEAFEYLLPYIDAVNIDLKTFNQQTYKKFCYGDLEPVKETIRIAYKHAHVEVTTLIVTDMNDNEEELTRLFHWLSTIDKKLVLHLSKYYPNYNYHAPQTDTQFIYRMAEKAKQYLDYVYVGNV